MKYKSDGIRSERQIRHFSRFILSAIRQLDVFASIACEVVFSNIDPSIADVVEVGENNLVEHNLIALTRVANGVDRAFARSANGRDAYINGIGAIARTCGEFPLTGTGCG